MDKWVKGLHWVVPPSAGCLVTDAIAYARH